MLNTFMEIGILVVGFILLIKGADFFVDGSSSVAKRLKSSFNDHWTYNCRHGYKFTNAQSVSLPQ